MNNEELTIDMGTLYEVNKNIVLKNLKDLEGKELNSKQIIIKDWLHKINNKYYMMLCNELKDYTVFLCKDDQEKDMAECIIKECLPNRGYVRSIEITEDKQAVEIWLVINEEAYVYYLFPYDQGIVTFDEEVL